MTAESLQPATEGTWWAKIRRADKHLQEFIAELARLQSLTVDFEVTTEHDVVAGVDLLIVHGYIDNVGTNDLAAVVGDILSNTRDSLDHIMKGLTGRRRFNFPMLEEPDDQYFGRATIGMAPEAKALVHSVQPFMNPEFGPKQDPLSVLRRMCNTDKHTTLHLLGTLICDPVSTLFINGEKIGEYNNTPSKYMSGGRIGNFAFPAQQNFTVTACGQVELWLTDAERLNLNWVIPDTLERIVKYVRERILEPLDPFTR